MFYFLFSGIQTQAYRPVDLVLFTESSVREILAQDNQRQSKGKFCSLFIVAAVFTIITAIILLRTMSDILTIWAQTVLKVLVFNNYPKKKVENMP